MEGKYLKARDRWQGLNTKEKYEARTGAKYTVYLVRWTTPIFGEMGHTYVKVEKSKIVENVPLE